MLNLRKLLGKEYTPLNRVEINSDNLIHNIKYIQSVRPEIDIFPNLKANAYGHGIVEIGKIIDKLNLKYIVVDSLFEAYSLLENGIKTNILIAGYVVPENLSIKKLPFSYAVWSSDQVTEILKHQPDAKLHLFVDTGMYREGIRFDELKDFLGSISDFKSNFEGIMSHFASSDDLQSKQNKEQFHSFKNAIAVCEKFGLKFKYKHLSNSAGILYNDNTSLDSARVGLSIYGLDSVGKENKLKPILSLKSQIVQIKKLKKGEVVGYNATFKADKDMKIAILPIGYCDGVERTLSNKGYVKVKDKFCRIIGRVSMNIMTIDISELENPQIGEEVVIFSDKSGDLNSIQNAAKLCDTIPYVLLVHISPLIKRFVN